MSRRLPFPARAGGVGSKSALFVLPAVLFQLSWGWYPLVAAFLLSFTNARIRSPIAFTGLESYLRMWHDPLAIQAFRVTALYAGADDPADVRRARSSSPSC